MLILLILLPLISYTKEFRFQLFGGIVYNLPTPLIIKQSGEKTIETTARYETRPFETVPAPYYVVRLGLWDRGKAWELELLHTKLYLKNKPPQVQEFKITYGYNYLLLNRAWELGGFAYRLGGGLIITHPSSVIRGKKNRYVRYDLSGVGVQFGVEKFIKVKHFMLSLEGKLTGAYAEVPVADGYAVVPNLALHLTFGFGFYK